LQPTVGSILGCRTWGYRKPTVFMACLNVGNNPSSKQKLKIMIWIITDEDCKKIPRIGSWFLCSETSFFFFFIFSDSNVTYYCETKVFKTKQINEHHQVERELAWKLRDQGQCCAGGPAGILKKGHYRAGRVA
jgi:hypothetical protein